MKVPDMIVAPSAELRRNELQTRCEAQRVTLAAQVADIEQRMHGADQVLGTVTSFIRKPSVLAGGAALLLTLGRSGWWSTLSRGLVLVAAARRVYGVLKQK